jgi:hypothetical protein
MQPHSLSPNDATVFLVLISIVGGLAAIGIMVAGVVAVTRIATRHRERMARIGMGLNPDGPEPPSFAPPSFAPPNAAIPQTSENSWNRFGAESTPAANQR